MMTNEAKALADAAEASCPDPAGLELTAPSADLFARADAWTSMSPDLRAQQRRLEYWQGLAYLVDFGGELLTQEDVARYCVAWSAWLAALARCASTIVTGGSNFPVRRAQKASATADKRYMELAAVRKRIMARITSAKKAAEVDAAGGPLEILRQEVAELEAKSVLMKAANRVVRAKPKNERTGAKVEKLVSMGVGPALAESLFEADFCGRYGYPDFELTAARSAIKRKGERLVVLQRREQAAAQDDAVHAFPGVTVTMAYSDERVRIEHDSKPPAEVRRHLKGAGWRWSSFNNAWQRLLTTSALRSAEELLGVRIERGTS